MGNAIGTAAASTYADLALQGFWIYTILSAIGLILVALLADETWYDRSSISHLEAERKSKILRLLGVQQWSDMRRSGASFVRAVSRPLIAISKLPVLLCVVYYFINFSWVIGVNATTSVWLTSLYGFDGKSLGERQV